MNKSLCEMAKQERKKRPLEKNEDNFDFLNNIRVSVRRQDSTLVKDVSLGIALQNINFVSIRL